MESQSNIGQSVKSELTRRSFLGGTGIVLASLTGILAGCSAAPAAKESEKAEFTQNAPVSFDEEMTCDIVIVGGGGSGLAACVEAAEQGLEVICVESQGQTGGNLAIVEGIFAVGSSMQNEQGIEIETGDIVRHEMEQGQYRISSLGYIDLIKRSGENIDWLLDHGVTFNGVDPDHGTVPLFHRFEESSGRTGYIPPMTAAAEAAGVQFLLNTHGDSIIQDDNGSIQGIYATKKDGAILKINAKAVIIATGGYTDNDDYMRKVGLNPDEIIRMGLPGHDGVGHDMAIACGAQDNMSNAAFIGDVSIKGLPTFFEGGKFNPIFCTNNPTSLWLNENGERFLNEDFSLTNMMLSVVPTLWRKSTYVFVDSAMMANYIAGAESLQAETSLGGWSNETGAGQELQNALDSGEIIQADTLEELAAAVGFNEAVLKKTIERYNECVETGKDLDFGKDASHLTAIGNGPYYLARVTTAANCSTASIKTDRNFNAIDANNEPIDGLYVIGVEGAMLWSNVYTVNIAGGCNANNVNSARTAVQHAKANCI